MLTRRTVVPVVLSGLLLPSVSLLSEYALAQGLSRKPVTIVVPFPAGGPTDAMARVLGEAISEGSGQTVIVDNRSFG